MPTNQPRFALGQVVATPGALEALQEANQTPFEFLQRHIAGDWGEVSAEDSQENEFSVQHGLRILSAYTLTTDGEQVTAIQHRFVDPQLEKSERYSLKMGSSPLVFGLNVLTPAETVVVVEGEFNCMAINQVGLQAVSVGSESSRGIEEVVTLLREQLVSYEQVAVWFDNAEYGWQFAERLTKDLPFRTVLHARRVRHGG